MASIAARVLKRHGSLRLSLHLARAAAIETPSLNVPALSCSLHSRATGKSILPASFVALRSSLPFHIQRRSIYSDLNELPTVNDPKIAKALNLLVAHPWLEIEEDVKQDVEKALTESSDEAGKVTLQTAWAAAEAVEAFGEKLEHLRMALDELSGGKFGGEEVADIPEGLKEALKSSLRRYNKYLEAFEEGEDWIKKKVEVELGGSLLTVKQRCSGLEAAWGKVSLLGTSGLSGSYIEKRAGLQQG